MDMQWVSASMQGLLNNVCKVLKHKGYIDTEQWASHPMDIAASITFHASLVQRLQGTET
jgi:hypothetical protein